MSHGSLLEFSLTSSEDVINLLKKLPKLFVMEILQKTKLKFCTKRIEILRSRTTTKTTVNLWGLVDCIGSRLECKTWILSRRDGGKGLKPPADMTEHVYAYRRA